MVAIKGDLEIKIEVLCGLACRLDGVFRRFAIDFGQILDLICRGGVLFVVGFVVHGDLGVRMIGISLDGNFQIVSVAGNPVGEALPVVFSEEVSQVGHVVEGDLLPVLVIGIHAENSTGTHGLGGSGFFGVFPGLA